MTKAIALTHKFIVTVLPKPPFNFDGTFHKPSHFPDKLSEWEQETYWQTIRINSQIVGLKIEDKGIEKPKLKVTVYFKRNISRDDIEALKNELVWRFQLDEDLSEFIQLCKRDRRFYPVLRKWAGTRNSCAHSLYELLIITVLLQNATIRRTVLMTEALLERYGTKIKFGGKEFFSLWKPKEMNNVSEQDLRDLKVGYRAKFIKRLSRDFSDGKIDEPALRKMDKDAAKKELMKLYGIGPESVRILLFEALHHYDTFEHIAPWQQKIYSRLFYNKPLVPANKIRDDIKKAYGKYAMLAVHYIWEDVFWKRKNQHIGWLEKEIRL